MWLAPTQVVILPISEKFNSYAKKVLQLLNNSDIRGLVDERDEKIGKKIRDSELKKIPFMLIVGEKEVAEDKVAIRKHGQGDQGSVPVQEFIDQVNKEIKDQLEVN